MFERIKDVDHPDEELLSVYREHGVVRREGRADNFNKAALDRSIYQLIHPGWFVVNRMKAWQGSVGVSPYRGIVSGHYICFRPTHDEDHRFLNWLFRSGAYTAEYSSLSRGVRPNQVEIDNDWLRSLRVMLPPLEEQRRIADFLDAETSRIDKLVLLQEQVAKKLDERERAQLDSAVDRLAERWGVVPLRRFLLGVDQGTSPQAEAVSAGLDEWGVLKVSCLRPGRFIHDENKRLPPDLEPDIKHEVQAGDLLITRANTPQLVGSTAVVGQTRAKLLLSDKIFRVHLDKRMTGEFVAMVARGTRIRDLCAASSNGASQSMANIRFEEVKAWPLPAADLDAQNKAVRHVGQQRASLDDLRTKIARQNLLLAERRQSLITAAVTGQFDASTASGRNVTE
ncbi:restriction endonuclease subunit S [Streptomyces sp. NPDC059897]|uniref:restriction endonuclease subunit S n=1 Tax=Streptomyces sp. NPDC059897 TaxID=3346994 RepID=UPI00364AD5A7